MNKPIFPWPFPTQNKALQPRKTSDAEIDMEPTEESGPSEVAIDTADHVRHAPSGEDWVVAYVRGDRLCACGWPYTLAELSDCTLIKKATEEERMQLLRDMASNNHDARGAYARDRLASTGETP